jgi:hypothetical protein
MPSMTHCTLNGCLQVVMAICAFASPAIAAPGDNFIGTITFVPAEPRAYEPVHVHFKGFNTCISVEGDLEFENGRFVLLADGICGVPPGGDPYEADYIMGRLPPGDWSVDLRYVLDGPTVETFTVTVTPASWRGDEYGPVGGTLDVSGAWGIAGRNGHGVVLTQSADGLLAGLVFTYANNGVADWFSLQSGERFEYGFWLGDVWRTRGTAWSAPPLGTAPTYDKIGSATLRFPTATRGEFCLYSPDADFSTFPYPVPLRCEQLERFSFY